MRAWNQPDRPALPGRGRAVVITDTKGREISPADSATIYVCGITPYDATHLGHAFTYVSFDLLIRAWLDQGLSVTYAQNITDIDDPLFERAEQTDVNWRELADSQIELFRSDMEYLSVIPPQSWIAVSEITDELESLVRNMVAAGRAYSIADGERTNIYGTVTKDDLSSAHLSGLNLEGLLRETGEDPELPGKQNPYDPMLWKGVLGDDYQAEGDRPGAWRPGWHIECAYIASRELGSVTVAGGGSDLVFPHQEMTALNLADMGIEVEGQMNSGIVSYKGEKMSKSVGNLIRVSRLIDRGYEAPAIRLLLVSHQWCENWEYTTDDIVEAERRLTRWRRVKHQGGAGAAELLDVVRGHLANNLDSASAVRAIDDWVGSTGTGNDPAGAALFSDMCDALLGVHL